MNERKPILYVDDEENNLTVFEAAFEDDYEVFTASSGAEALALMEHQPVHVLITDMRMPGMNGVELLERVLPDYPDVVRMVLTGYTDVGSIIRAINQGNVHQYITKPWDERELRVVIDRGLERYAAVQRETQLRAELDAAIRSENAIRSVFQRFVPPNVADGVLRDAANAVPSPSSEAREVTLLFADIRGFTALCSAHPPPLILDLLNEYFARMTEIIDAHSGSVNQFLGDGLLAVFGAPIEVVDSARCAVRAACEMVEAIEGFNRRAMELVGRPIQIGIGIQHGVASVGVVTAQDRAFYCAAGPPIDQVMRVEEFSKGHHNSIVITETALQSARDEVEVVPCGDVTFEGSPGPVSIYRICGWN